MEVARDALDGPERGEGEVMEDRQPLLEGKLDRVSSASFGRLGLENAADEVGLLQAVGGIDSWEEKEGDGEGGGLWREEGEILN